jgi:hypothetical protein
MRSPLVAVVAVLALVAVALPVTAQDFQEPKSKVAFAIDDGDLVLLGTGLRVKKIQDAMRDALEEGSDPEVLARFISYFPEVKKGERCTLRWVPGRRWRPA